MTKFLHSKLIFIFSILISSTLSAQIAIDTTLTPTELVQQVLLGNGVTVSNITFNGGSGDILSKQIARFTGGSSVVEFPEAVVLYTASTTDLDTAAANITFPFPDPEVENDPDLIQISNQNNINDCAILEFDFVPNGDSLVFRYVFGSNEYPGFTCSGFNDAFGFFISGPGINGPFSDNAMNIALVPDTDIPVAINTINSGSASGGNDQPCLDANPNFVNDSIYFVDNGDQPDGDVLLPGLTVTLTAFANVICGEEYHIKLAIGDASDGALDSGVFLEAGSFTSNSAVQVNLDIPVGVNDSTLYEGCGEAALQFIRPAASSGIEETAFLEISGTALNGIDFSPALPDSVVFPVGIDTVSFVLTAPNDANFEGVEFVDVVITNVASSCSGATLTSNFRFYINEDDPLVVTGFNDTLVDCNDAVFLFPTITGGYGNYNYSWSNGASSDSINASPGFSTTYFVTVSDTCGVSGVQTSFDVEVPAYPPIQFDLGEDFEVNECNVTINLTADPVGGFGNYQYQWTANGSPTSNSQNLTYFLEETTDIALTVTDDCGATTIDNVLVTVPDVIVTAYLPDTYTASSCLDDFLLPAITDGGIGQRSHLWIIDGDTAIQTLSNFFVYNPAMGQNVRIIAEDECGNTATDSTFVVFDFPDVVIETSRDTAICEKTGALLEVDILEGSGNYKINWGGSDTTIYRVFPEGTVSYPVVVTDTCGMRAEKSVKVTVRNVRADFDYQYLEYYGLQLTNYSRAVNPTYFWDFGDGNSSTLADPSHFYTDVDPFTIVLTTTDDIGCQDTVKLNTIPPIEVFIPSSFTPNGDGINDLWGVKASNLFEFEVRIFDRWGKKVFQSNDIDQKWNGSNQNNEFQSQMQIYNYVIRYKGKKEEDTKELTGSITIIR